MSEVSKLIGLLCIVITGPQVIAQQNKTDNASSQLLYLRSTAQSPHFDILKKCDDLTIARYRELGVEIIERPYTDVQNWLQAKAADMKQATNYMQYLAYARSQNIQAIGGLSIANLEAREAGWYKAEPGSYVYGWNINRASLTHHFLFDVSGGMSVRAVPLHLAGSSEPPWALVSHAAPSTCQSTGKLLRDFTTEDINGQEIRTQDLRGKVVLVDFWASWCKPCLEEFPIIQALRDKLPASDFIWISVSVDENDRPWRQFVTNNKLGGTQIRDTRVLWKRLFEVSSYPSAFVIDREGIIHCRVRGDEIPKAVLSMMSPTNTPISK